MLPRLRIGALRHGAVKTDTWSACLNRRLLPQEGDDWRAVLFGAPPATA